MSALVLYFHGGPGLHSRHEEKVLGPRLLKAGLEFRAWHEPSVQRGTAKQPVDFSSWLKGAEEFFLAQKAAHAGVPVLLVGHSFGAQAVAHLLQRHPLLVQGAVFVAPGLNAMAAYANVLRMASELYVEDGRSDLAVGLAQAAARVPEAPDAEFLEYLGVALAHPRLQAEYWHRPEAFAAWASEFSEPGFAPDVENFKRGVSTFQPEARQTGGARLPFPGLVVALYGKQDRISRAESERAFLERCVGKPAVELTLSGARHWPQFEVTDAFVEQVVLAAERMGAATAVQEAEAEELHLAR